MSLWAWFLNVFAGQGVKEPSVGISVTLPTGYKKQSRKKETKPTAKWRWFTDEEVKGLDQTLVQMLDAARGMAGVPFSITSGLRLPRDNEATGGVKNSAHLRGKAVDIASHSSNSHFEIVRAALAVGFKRIGIYHDQNGEPSHLHLDNDGLLPQRVIWFGESK